MISELLQWSRGSCGLLQWALGWHQQQQHRLPVLKAEVAALSGHYSWTGRRAYQKETLHQEAQYIL